MGQRDHMQPVAVLVGDASPSALVVLDVLIDLCSGSRLFPHPLSGCPSQAYDGAWLERVDDPLVDWPAGSEEVLLFGGVYRRFVNRPGEDHVAGRNRPRVERTLAKHVQDRPLIWVLARLMVAPLLIRIGRPGVMVSAVKLKVLAHRQSGV